MFKLILFCSFAISVAHCKNIIAGSNNDVNAGNSNLVKESVVVSAPELKPEVRFDVRRSRKRVTSLREALNCGFDVSCFLDTVEHVVNDRRRLILAEADMQYMRSYNSRSVSNEAPSELADTIQGIISKMADLVRDAVMNWFREEKSADDIDDNNVSQQSEDSEEEEEENDEDTKEVNDEARGKKKRKKFQSIMKLLIIGAVLKAKITLLLQLLSAALQIKFFFIALAGLLINKIRLWYDLKKGHQPQKVIYYEHAQHQHHYDHLDDEHGGFWGRAYEVPKDAEESAQDVAYRGQKPIPWSAPDH